MRRSHSSPETAGSSRSDPPQLPFPRLVLPNKTNFHRKWTKCSRFRHHGLHKGMTVCCGEQTDTCSENGHDLAARVHVQVPSSVVQNLLAAQPVLVPDIAWRRWKTIWGRTVSPILFSSFKSAPRASRSSTILQRSSALIADTIQPTQCTEGGILPHDDLPLRLPSVQSALQWIVW